MTSFWHAPHRPFFLLCGLWAVIVPTVWLWPWGPDDPVFWHMHELSFGMGGAAAGGYLLTALPSWTGQSRAGPRQVKALVALWLAGRVCILAGDLPGPRISAAIAASYFVMMFVVLLRPVIAARNYRKLPVVAAPLVLAAADTAILWHRPGEAASQQAPVLAVLAYAWLIALIGGRAVPAFAKSWLERSGRRGRVYAPALLSRLGVAGVAAGLVLVMASQGGAAATVLILTGILQIGRMAGWQPRQVLGSAPLFMLCAAWLWHGAGLLLTGLALAGNHALPLSTALHAMTTGAMGTMILAVAGRSTMRQTARGLVAPMSLKWGFALVCCSAALRVAAPFVITITDPIRISAILWIAGWSLFLIALLPVLIGPASHPVLSARRSIDP